MTATAGDRPRRVPIDPRIRERRIEVQREAGRRQLRVTLVIASTIIVVGLAYLTMRSPLLDVDQIRITGAGRETTAEVQAATGVRHGDPLLFVDAAVVAHRIERMARVEHAVVHRDLPGTLRVAVTDYVPTAYLRTSDGRFALVAANGRVIALARAASPGAVEVRGVRVVPAVGSLLSPPDAANVVEQLPARLGAQVKTIDVTGPGVALELRGAGQVRLGTLDDLPAKGAAALAVLDHLGGKAFSYIDVAAPQAPVSR